ncbi:MAG: Thiol:disulfide interchange protein DsbC [Catillopecten margaritatus gill symbiont]|uniref:Thiol:disulfide interchange protein n=1 Tax=Catillopecten margaritatus gill symbiont TaxID=3083288 RepID=A0AAU6PEQ5_9GAMM
MFKKILFALLISTQTFADKTDVINNLSPFFGEIDKADIVETNFNGVYEVILHNPIDSIFVSSDGNHFIKGEIIDIKTRQSLSHVGTFKQKLIDTVTDEDKIIFKAKDEKYTINVFTDVDCPFCKRLHAQIEKTNNLGVTVKYLAMPISELHPTAQGKMEKIWCAEDRVKAMHDYKTEGTIPDSKNCKNPVKQQLKLARQLGVNGTPAIFLSDGTHLPGYVSSSELLQIIQQKIGK